MRDSVCVFVLSEQVGVSRLSWVTLGLLSEVQIPLEAGVWLQFLLQPDVLRDGAAGLGFSSSCHRSVAWSDCRVDVRCAALKVSFFHEMIPVCSRLQSSCRILERLVFMAKSLNVYNECSQFLISFIKYFSNIYLEDNCD